MAPVAVSLALNLGGAGALSKPRERTGFVH